MKNKLLILSIILTIAIVLTSAFYVERERNNQASLGAKAIIEAIFTCPNPYLYDVEAVKKALNLPKEENIRAVEKISKTHMANWEQ